MPDSSAFPVWADRGMVDPETLPISETLRNDLQAWNDDYTNTGGVAPDVYQRPSDWDAEPFRERGRMLAERMMEELGPEFEVTVILQDG